MYDPSKSILLSGTTFVKNMLKYSYCTKATIDCLLDYADEVLINVGKSEDDTEKYIQDLYGSNPKVKIFVRDWPGREHGTLFYRQETNFIVRQAVGRWILHLQGDECCLASERDYLYSQLYKHNNHIGTGGFTSRYYHFEGDFSSIRGGYPLETRVIRNVDKIYAFGDAQSWAIEGMPQTFFRNYRNPDGSLVAPVIDFHIFHLGYVRPPEVMLQKTMLMDSFYHTGEDLDRMNKETMKSCPDSKWHYGHMGMACYHGLLPKYLKDYVIEYEERWPELIRIPGRFEDEPDSEIVAFNV